MKAPAPALLATIAALLAGGPAPGASPGKGEKAPPVEPKEWINAPPNPSWSTFRGRLVLVEKWATWCGPCRQSIPHLGDLHGKYAKKGLTIIGVSDEAPGTVKPFIEKLNVAYIIGIGGAEGYKTEGIPHAWLVGADGTVAWEGHPLELKEATIEEHLRGVRLAPEFKLPKELASAQKLLDAEKYGAAIQDLEKHLKKPKGGESEKAAREALEAVKKLGDEKAAEADELAKGKDYIEALRTLAWVEKGFSGTPAAEKAKALKSKLLADKEVKVEIAGAEQIERARDLIRQKKTKPAGEILKAVANGARFKGTRAQEQARKELARIGA